MCSDRFVFFRVEQPTTDTGRGRMVWWWWWGVVVKAYGACE